MRASLSRRDFLRRASLVAAGVVAADQLGILERLSSRRVFTTGGYEPAWTSLHELSTSTYPRWSAGPAWPGKIFDGYALRGQITAIHDGYVTAAF